MKTKQTVAHVPIERLTAHPANIRDDLGDLTEMARSIVEHGILQPLTATEDPNRDGALLLLAGHRRLAAACLAKLDVVPVIIRHGIDQLDEQLIVMLVENTQRRDLNPVERAEAYAALRNRGLTITEIALRTGTAAANVSYYLRILDLPEEDREEIRAGARGVTNAIARVRAELQEERARAAGRPIGRPKGRKTTPHFSDKHPLARTVAAMCDHRGVPKVGSVGCGPCWERVIRADAVGEHIDVPERPTQLARHKPYDEAAVLRSLNGDKTVRLRPADRREVVRRCHANGMTDLQVEDLTAISDKTIGRIREELGLEPNGNGRHKDEEAS